jgi:hypothetical protein
MNMRPWDYWTHDGQPQPDTMEIVGTLEEALQWNPDHIGACHYYIHAVEAWEPARALPCVERLSSLAPGAGHLVHMPSHIYIRVGRYDKAVEVTRMQSRWISIISQALMWPVSIRPATTRTIFISCGRR